MMGLFDTFDWDGNGKHDIFDDLLEFMIADACTSKDDKNEYEDDLDFDEDYDFDEDDLDI